MSPPQANKLHLVDGTFELFRSFYGAPRAQSPSGAEVGAVRGLMRSMFSLVRQPDVSHVAVAFDTVIESFRNRLFAGYKTGAGIDPLLLSQFALAERATAALGIIVWSMVEFEADDAMATGAARYRDQVEQVVLCSPDKDLAQCVVGQRVVCLDRIRGRVLDDAGVREKFGIAPASIPDYLALVGDTADGIPGIARWGAKSASAVLARYGHLEDIPGDASRWEVKVRGVSALSDNLEAGRDDAELYRTLAVLRTDVPLPHTLDQLRWSGPSDELEALCEEIGGSAQRFRMRAPS